MKHLDAIAAPLMVETGCQRAANDHGAGMSSTIFGRYFQGRGAGKLLSIDLDPQLVRLRPRASRGLAGGSDRMRIQTVVDGL